MEPIDLTTLSSDVRRGPLFERQRAMGATFYEDYGRLWAASFGDLDREYAAIRTGAMVWDISPLSKFHMVGPQVREALERLTSRPISGEEPGQVRYLVILDEAGHIVDEGTRYLIGPDEAWYVGNEDRPALVEHIAAALEGFDVTTTNRTDEVAALAIQGPEAFDVLAPLIDVDLASLDYYRCRPDVAVAGVPAMISRTGFSGELGYELFVPDGVDRVWDALLEAGATPVGLDAVEMARVEVGFLVADEDYVSFETDPYEVGLGAVHRSDRARVRRQGGCPRRLAGRAPGARDAGVRRTLRCCRPPARSPSTAAWWERSAAWNGRPGSGCWAWRSLDADLAVDGAFVEVDGIAAVVRPRPIDDGDRARRTRPGG